MSIYEGTEPGTTTGTDPAEVVMDQATQAATQMAAAITAANAAAITATALSAAVSSMATSSSSHPSQAIATAESRVEQQRDPMLRDFEQYLLRNLRASDVATDEEGVFVFNVNQVAYLAEECDTKDKQKATREKVKEALHSRHLVPRKCPRTGNGELHEQTDHKS
jgi:hypothetical protein